MKRLTTQELLEWSKNNAHKFHKQDIINDFENIYRYRKHVTSLAESAELADEKSIRESSTDIDEYTESMNLNEIFHKYAAPRMLRYSLIMYLCAMIEQKFSIIAKKLFVSGRSKEEPQIYLDKYKGNDPLRKKIALYIEKETSVSIHKDNGWSVIDDVFEIRNIIAHVGGSPKLGKNRSKINNITRKYGKFGMHITPEFNMLHISVLDRVELSDEICDFFISQAILFFNKILDQIGPPFIGI